MKYENKPDQISLYWLFKLFDHRNPGYVKAHRTHGDFPHLCDLVVIAVSTEFMEELQNNPLASHLRYNKTSYRICFTLPVVPLASRSTISTGGKKNKKLEGISLWLFQIILLSASLFLFSFHFSSAKLFCIGAVPSITHFVAFPWLYNQECCVVIVYSHFMLYRNMSYLMLLPDSSSQCVCGKKDKTNKWLPQVIAAKTRFTNCWVMKIRNISHFVFCCLSEVVFA